MSAEPKVLLTFEDGDIIVAKRFGHAGKGLIGVTAACDDGSRRLFAVNANPSNAELWRIEVGAAASYEEKREAIEWTMKELDERGDDVPDLSTLEQIDAWLLAEAPMDEYQLQEWAEEANQYAPGFAIQEALTSEERKALGLRVQDLGGPASSVWCVSITASMDEMNKLLAAKKLPFIFVDDEGPEDWH